MKPKILLLDRCVRFESFSEVTNMSQTRWPPPRLTADIDPNQTSQASRRQANRGHFHRQAQTRALTREAQPSASSLLMFLPLPDLRGM